MLNTFLVISILASAATSAVTEGAHPVAMADSAAVIAVTTPSKFTPDQTNPAIVVAQASKRSHADRRRAPPRRLDANAIIKSLAPIEYLPEHSGKKRLYGRVRLAVLGQGIIPVSA